MKNENERGSSRSGIGRNESKVTINLGSDAPSWRKSLSQAIDVKEDKRDNIQEKVMKELSSSDKYEMAENSINEKYKSEKEKDSINRENVGIQWNGKSDKDNNRTEENISMHDMQVG